jgi:hypothetical protein
MLFRVESHFRSMAENLACQIVRSEAHSTEQKNSPPCRNPRREAAGRQGFQEKRSSVSIEIVRRDEQQGRTAGFTSGTTSGGAGTTTKEPHGLQ